MTANVTATTRAELSATTGTVGDPVTLELGALDSDNVYGASLRITYDATKFAFDPETVSSEFDGMFSAVATVDGDAGAVEFSVTRLGTSSGLEGDLDLGTIGFTSTGAGETQLVIESLKLVDSELMLVDEAPAKTLDLAFVAPPEPEPEPEPEPQPETPTNPNPGGGTPTNPTTPSVPSTGPQTSPVVVTGYGTAPQRPTTRSTTPTTPFQAAPTNDAPKIVASSTTITAGDDVTLTITGLTPSTEHEIELHSEPIALGSAESGTDGRLVFEASIPEDAPTGAHEIVVLENDSTVATLPVTIAEAEDASTTATPAPSAAPADDETDEAATTAAESDGPDLLWLVWLLVAVVVVLIALVTLLMVRRSKGGATND